MSYERVSCIVGTVYDVNLDINGLGPVRKQARWGIHQIIRDRQQGPCSDRLRARRHLYGCSLPVFITGPCKLGGGGGGVTAAYLTASCVVFRCLSAGPYDTSLRRRVRVTAPSLSFLADTCFCPRILGLSTPRVLDAPLRTLAFVPTSLAQVHSTSVFSVALRPQTPWVLLGTGSPAWPPQLSHSRLHESWTDRRYDDGFSEGQSYWARSRRLMSSKARRGCAKFLNTWNRDCKTTQAILFK